MSARRAGGMVNSKKLGEGVVVRLPEKRDEKEDWASLLALLLPLRQGHWHSCSWRVFGLSGRLRVSPERDSRLAVCWVKLSDHVSGHVSSMGLGDKQLEGGRGCPR